MKKLILLILLFIFSLPIMAQNTVFVDTTASGDETRRYVGTFTNDTRPKTGRLPVSFYGETIGLSSVGSTLVDTLYGTITLTAGSTAYQFSALIADTLDVYSVTFTPYTSGAIVHFGTDNSLTIDNGAQPSYYTWDCTRYGDSTTDFWLASTANTTKVRYTIKIRR